MLALAALLGLQPVGAAAQVHKCVRQGAVTYQNTPCPPTLARLAPTADQLNQERRRKLALAQTQAQADPPPPAGGAPAPAPGADRAPPAGRAAARAGTPYACDGRTRCSQMTSCAEAQYFLAHCPGVKMDGNHDGRPCELQWCGR